MRILAVKRNKKETLQGRSQDLGRGGAEKLSECKGFDTAGSVFFCRAKREKFLGFALPPRWTEKWIAGVDFTEKFTCAVGFH